MIMMNLRVIGACIVMTLALGVAQAAPKKDIWVCPMHSQVKREAPGRCPICGMDLVKADLGEVIPEQPQTKLPDAHVPFKLSFEREQLIGVKYGFVEKKELFKAIHASGRVAFDPDLYAAQGEYLEALKQEERVRKSAIADIRSSAERMVESAKLRLKILGLSDSQIAKLKGTETLSQSLLLRKAGDEIWIYAEIYEMDLPYVQAGLSAEISSGFMHGKSLAGKIASVDRVLNASTRTAKARIMVPKAKGELRPETFVDVTIRSPLGKQVTVPMDAVFDTGTQAWVFVAKAEGMFEPRLVSLRFRVDDEVAIEDGVRPGEKIVISAGFLIDSESRLKAAVSDVVASPSCPKGQHWDMGMKMCHPD